MTERDANGKSWNYLMGAGAAVTLTIALAAFVNSIRDADKDDIRRERLEGDRALQEQVGILNDRINRLSERLTILEERRPKQ